MSQLPSKSALLWCVCRDFFPDWDESLNTAVSLLRTEAGRAHHNTDLTGLIGELVTRSEEYRTAWAKHNVRLHHTGRKSIRHPAIGVLILDFGAMELPAQPGLTLTAYTATPGTPDYDALRLLAGRAATENTSPRGSHGPADGRTGEHGAVIAQRLMREFCGRPRGDHVSLGRRWFVQDPVEFPLPKVQASMSR